MGRECRERGGMAQLGYLYRVPEFIVTPLDSCEKLTQPDPIQPMNGPNPCPSLIQPFSSAVYG